MGPPVAQPVPGGFATPAAAQQGWGAPPAAPPPQGPPPGYAPQAPAPQVSGGNVFGAGAFAGAAPVSDRKDCQDGDYVFQIIKTEQYRTREGKPMFRILCKIAHVFSGTQPVGSEVTDSIYFGFPGADAFKYGMADMLFLAAYALGCASDHELRAKLQAWKSECPDAWAALADAMQDPNQVANPFFGPNPLAGMFYRAQVQHTPHKTKPGKFNMNVTRLLAKAG
jgi:hypothetical protein